MTPDVLRQWAALRNRDLYGQWPDCYEVVCSDTLIGKGRACLGAKVNTEQARVEAMALPFVPFAARRIFPIIRSISRSVATVARRAFPAQVMAVGVALLGGNACLVRNSNGISSS